MVLKAKNPAQPTIDPRNVEDPTTVPGLNIRKGGEDPPIRADEEYPDWVWTLGDELPTLNQLQKIPAEERTDEQNKRFKRLTRRAKIKENNLRNDFK